MSSFVIALTGGIGSGKSSVADLFAALGINVIDSDTISHQLTAKGGGAIQALQDAFGPGILTPDGALDRAQMRRLVFEDAAVRRKLESILHPLIATEAARLLAIANSAYAIRMIPLLVEGGDPHRRFPRVLVVDCREETQINRVMKRSGFSRAEVENIMSTQATRAERLAYADDVIDNDGPQETLPPQVERLHRKYLELASGT
ncbi:MAG TPA: dephospho-CoA kinase [Burkholderiales bacterium]|nr:dephospho-CoA kinase [Burkholderiales bacterium]